MIALYIDADACPVKQEIYRVAERHAREGRRRSRSSSSATARSRCRAMRLIERVVVGAGMDEADNWIAERAKRGDIVITADVPLASRAVKAGAAVIAPNGKRFHRGLDRQRAGDAQSFGFAALGRRDHRRPEAVRAARPLRISLRAGPRHRAADARGAWAARLRSAKYAAFPAGVALLTIPGNMRIIGHAPIDIGPRHRYMR